IVFDAGEGALPRSETIQKLADRRTGIGFDQALALLPSTQPDVDVFYRIFNADGSEVEQCGNGARCIGKLVAERIARSEVRMQSPGGRTTAVLRGDGLVTVDMGIPNFAPESLPF